MTDDPGRLALSYAMDLAGRQPGQPWGPEPIVAAAEKFRDFLSNGEEPEAMIWLRNHGQKINDLFERLDTLERSLTPQRSKRAATSTTPPEDIPTPVDF